MSEYVFDDDGESISRKENGNNDNIVKHIISSYGGITSLLASTSGIVSYIPKLATNKYFSYFGKAISSSIVAYDLYTKVKMYYDANSESLNTKKMQYINSIFGNDDDDMYMYKYEQRDINITSEHLYWLLDPHTDNMGGIEIKAYFDLVNGKRFNSPPPERVFSVLLSFKETEYLIELDSITLFESGVSYMFKKLYTLDDDNIRAMMDVIRAKYMENVGFNVNVIHYDGINIKTSPRSNSIDFDIESINFNGIKDNITTILDRGQRRGILFVGNPGTGKTSVLLKLESELTEYPILYVTASNLSDEYTITRLDSFIQNLGKCVIFIEDMDSIEIDKKTKRIAPILSLLDSSRSDSPVVFIATINDSSLITPSIVRTGRFDQIIEIKEPTQNTEIYNILQNAWSRHNTKKSFIQFPTNISWWTYYIMKRHKLTQSDYCEIVQKIRLDGDYVNNKTLTASTKELIKSKNAFNRYQDTL